MNLNKNAFFGVRKTEDEKKSVHRFPHAFHFAFSFLKTNHRTVFLDSAIVYISTFTSG